MPRKKRAVSDSGVYHVMARGMHQRIVFEGNTDRERFLDLLRKKREAHHVMLYAYALMDNHTHLLLKAKLPDLSSFMQSVLSSYAAWFNKSHEDRGPVFEARFRSEAIEDDAYFLTVLRYIHANPLRAGITTTMNCALTSYREYQSGADLVNTKLALNMLGGSDAFRQFHEQAYEDVPSAMNRQHKQRLTDKQAREKATGILGEARIRTLKSEGKASRDNALRQLKTAGIGIRQIQRMTGISLSCISRA